MEEKEFKELLEKYQRGTLEESRKKQVDAWYDSFGYSPDIDPLQDAEKKEAIYRSLNEKLRAYTIYAVVEKRLRKRYLYYMVASFALVVGVSVWIFLKQTGSVAGRLTLSYMSYDTVYTEIGSMKKVVLPDSSTVWLNAGSQLRYSPETYTVKREVFLDQGEAFFDVVRDPDNTFEVYAGAVRTAVLGTSFNIKNYSDLAYTSVHVKEGKVAVSALDCRIADTLVAGKGIRFNMGNTIFIRDDRFAMEAGSWVDGRVMLEGAKIDVGGHANDLKFTIDEYAVLMFLSLWQGAPLGKRQVIELVRNASLNHESGEKLKR